MNAFFGALVAAALLAGGAQAADLPAAQQGDYTIRDFRFHDGQVVPELRLHYLTLGNKAGEPVLVLHGTAGTGAGLLSPTLGGELFGPGQPLDASKYFIVLPDAIGHGKSSKPSDGMRAGFPHYDYDDMVAAQHTLLTEALGIKHLRLVIGFSMGGMETWLWGERYPDFMDALVPMAAQPTEMSGRNWMMRRLIIDAIRRDPDWHDGNYTEQPKLVRYASVWFGIATSGGSIAYAQQAPTRAAADRLVDQRLAAPYTEDANDVLYEWDASSDYNAAPDLERIKAKVLVINSADDERNPPETGLLDAALKRVKDAQYLLIPAGPDTRGHVTVLWAKLYAERLADFLAAVPKNGT